MAFVFKFTGRNLTFYFKSWQWRVMFSLKTNFRNKGLKFHMNNSQTVLVLKVDMGLNQDEIFRSMYLQCDEMFTFALLHNYLKKKQKKN